MHNAQRAGTITFLFTDIEGSTRLAQQHGGLWESLQDRHHALLQAAMEARGGHVFQIIGDAFCVAFDAALDGIAAALEAQRRLAAEPWGEAPIKVRMGLHTGPAERGGDRYRGYLTLARVQRVMSAAHGGQILASNATASLLGDLPAEGVALRDMREHHLKGFAEPERLWQVIAPDLPQDFPPLPTLKRPSNNLPIQPTNFIGREREMADVAALLKTARLVTLTGSGGTGKTRLSLQVAEHVEDNFKDGVWWTELAPILDPELVPASIAAALGIQEEPGRPALAGLTDWLRDKQLLLVLDNCEHLVRACAQTAEAIMRTSPQARLVATSREPLGIAGETTFRVPSMQVPPAVQGAMPDQITEFPSVRLFVDRASQASTSFRLTDKNAAAVAQICARLDGIPLAIELAAARVSAIAPDQIAARLDDRFRLLTRGSRASLARHETLRAMIDWSYDLLTEPERALLGMASVFAGGWTLEAAERVCVFDEPEADVLELLSNLVDKSLVNMEETEEGARYSMLETTRQYAQEKLKVAGQEQRLRDRHLAHFLSLAETAEGFLRSEPQVVWLSRLERELNNLRLALEWSQTSGQAEVGLRLATALHWFWNLRSLIREGHEWLARTLQFAESGDLSPGLRGRALYRVAHLAHYLGEPLAQRKAMLEESVALNRELNDLEGCGHSLVMLAWLISDEGEALALYEEALQYARRSTNGWLVPSTLLNMADLMIDLGRDEQALGYLDECIPEFRRYGDRRGTAWSLLLLANVKVRRGDHDGASALFDESTHLFGELRFLNGVRLVVFARANMELRQREYQQAAMLFEENLSLARNLGLRNAIAMGVFHLGHVLARLGDNERAAALMRESIVLFKESGLTSQIPLSLQGLAQVLVARGDPARAARLIGAAQAQTDALGPPLNPSGIDFRAEALEAARSALGEAPYAEAFSAGQRLTLDEAVRLALEMKPA